MNQANSVQNLVSRGLMMLMTLGLSACQLGSQWRGKHHLVKNKYIPLRTSPYACSKCQKSLEKTLISEYEHTRAGLSAEKQELGDFGPQDDFLH
jgi:hypothetical protein